MIILALITLLGAFTSCVAYGTGAPVDACSSLVPGHGANTPQTGRAPYTVTAENNGNIIKVTISSPGGEKFMGFILQARSANHREKLIAGAFKIDDKYKRINCDNHDQSTLTHSNKELKSEVTTEWTGTTNEDIIFRATVVKDYSHFWTNIDSNPVRTHEKEPQENMDSDDIGYDGCFESKGCFGMPTMCVEKKSCQVLLTFRTNDKGGIRFSLRGHLKPSEYMAMGISKDRRMGEDFVTECLRIHSAEVISRKSWNDAPNNKDTTEYNNYNASIVNDFTTCTWDEPKVLKFHDKTYDLTDKPFILLAHGMVKEMALDYHTTKSASAYSVDLFTSEFTHLEENDKGVAEGHSADPTSDGHSADPTSNEHSREPSSNEHSTDPTSDEHGTDPTSNFTNAPSCCSQLTLGLFWFAFIGVFTLAKGIY